MKISVLLLPYPSWPLAIPPCHTLPLTHLLSAKREKFCRNKDNFVLPYWTLQLHPGKVFGQSSFSINAPQTILTFSDKFWPSPPGESSPFSAFWWASKGFLKFPQTHSTFSHGPHIKHLYSEGNRNADQYASAWTDCSWPTHWVGCSPTYAAVGAFKIEPSMLCCPGFSDNSREPLKQTKQKKNKKPRHTLSCWKAFLCCKSQ